MRALGILLALAVPALADEPAERRPPPQQLFIAPTGQPFRAPAGAPYPVAAWFAQVDANHAGYIDRTKLRADATAYFKVLDRDHDGVVDGAEIEAYEHEVAPEILGERRVLLAPPSSASNSSTSGPTGGGRRGGGRGGRGGGGGWGGNGETSQTASFRNESAALDGAAPFTLLGDAEPVAEADVNLDQHITLKEYLAAVDRAFTALDVNESGRLSLSDLPQTAVQKAPKRDRRRHEGSRSR
jgi:EF hand